MAKTCSCVLVFSKHTIKNIVVFDDIRTYNLACFLLFWQHNGDVTSQNDIRESAGNKIKSNVNQVKRDDPQN
jgi:hypothetical protein